MPLNYTSTSAASCGCQENPEVLTPLCDNVLNLLLAQGATDELEIFFVGDRVQLRSLTVPDLITTEGFNVIGNAQKIKLVAYDEIGRYGPDLYEVVDSSPTTLTVSPDLPIIEDETFVSLVQLVPGCPQDDIPTAPTAIAILDATGVSLYGAVVTRFCADPTFFAATTFAGARTVTLADTKLAPTQAKNIYVGDAVTIASAGITDAKVLRVAESHPGTWYIELDQAATRDGCFQGVANQQKLEGILQAEQTDDGFRLTFDLSSFTCSDAMSFGCHNGAIQKFSVGHYTVFAQWVDDIRGVVRRYPILHGSLEAIATAA